jgi:hypothetical protein
MHHIIATRRTISNACVQPLTKMQRDIDELHFKAQFFVKYKIYTHKASVKYMQDKQFCDIIGIYNEMR